MPTALRYGTLFLGLGLVALGIGALVLPGPSSASYGVPSEDSTWVGAAGCRDLTLGLIVLALRARQPDALRHVLVAALLLPIGDAALVLLAGAPLQNTMPHVLGAGVLAALSVLAWRASPEVARTD